MGDRREHRITRALTNLRNSGCEVLEVTQSRDYLLEFERMGYKAVTVIDLGVMPVRGLVIMRKNDEFTKADRYWMNQIW